MYHGVFRLFFSFEVLQFLYSVSPYAFILIKCIVPDTTIPC